VASSRITSHDRSAQFADDFVVENAAGQQARRASHDLGIEPVSPATAQVLTLLTHLTSAASLVEIGTGAGVSALAFFAGMPAGGTLTSIDREAEHHLIARDVLKAAGVSHTQYRLITGDALSVLPKLRADAYDLVFVDGEFLEYPEYFEEALRIVRPGGLVILHHALLRGKVADEADFDDDTLLVRDTLEAARNLDGTTLALIPVGDGLLVCSTPAVPD